MFDDLQFESEEELRKPVPPGTVAAVQIRPDKDGVLGEFKSGTHEKFGPWMSVPFEVTEGEFKGEWANLMLNVQTTDRRFRKTVEVVTGVDLSQGAKLDFEDFKQALVNGVFEAELGPEKRRNRDTGDLEETGYTKVFRINRKIAERDQAASSNSTDQAVPAVGEKSEGNDEDIPF
jgi:hypothetical protein